jgi:hypothetical protein
VIESAEGNEGSNQLNRAAAPSWCSGAIHEQTFMLPGSTGVLALAGACRWEAFCHGGEAMHSALKRIAVAPLLLGFHIAVAVADEPPNLNVTITCNAAAQYSISAGRDKDACLGDERAAESTLAQNWSKYSAADKTQCIGTVTTGGPPSYVELLSCLEVMRDAKDSGDSDALGRTDQPVESAPQSVRHRRK